MTALPNFAAVLADNVRRLRELRGLTQAVLAKRSGIPRATLSLLESGGGNPTLGVALRVSHALDVRLDELLEQHADNTRVFRESELAVKRRGAATIRQLLPERVAGLEFERLTIPAGHTLVGAPHTAGTREYLAVQAGQLELIVAGTKHRVGAGDVAVFEGHQKHSYRNPGQVVADAFSVISFARGKGTSA